ncbi:MAG: hypothetical protein CO093_04255 [Alphaproteobacteria bacterium CG_4_9_14_3_um_filter_47_13]|nr:MAG: hypothetical protein CO093_04255 [Alphaproteobacteria bacterium CG_4_9_14_3_um_filter_47_13]
MTATDLKARPVPFLKTFFDPAAKGIELYPAPVARPFARIYGEPEIQNAYKNENGDVLFNTGSSDWYVLSAGSKEAYQLPQTGFGGSSKKFETSFSSELNREQSAKLKVNEDEGMASIKTSFDEMNLTILSDDKKTALLQSILNDEILCIGLPDVRDIEQALQLPNGDYMIVSCNRTDYAYETLRMFTGSSLDNLREIEMTDVQRYRDGGSTYYVSKEGTIFSPTPFKGNAATTWTPEGTGQAIELTKLDKDKVAQEIGNKDTRIKGAKTWAEYTQG